MTQPVTAEDNTTIVCFAGIVNLLKCFIYCLISEALAGRRPGGVEQAKWIGKRFFYCINEELTRLAGRAICQLICFIMNAELTEHIPENSDVR